RPNQPQAHQLAHHGPRLSHRRAVRLDPRPAWRAPAFVVPAMLAALVLALWLPFGLGATGLLEEWSLFAWVDRGEPVFALRTIPGHESRPLVVLGWALGYWLTPDSFVGLNLVHAALLLTKALLLYAVLARLAPGHRAVALVAAVLFVVYPADTAL